jgi:glycosyltransferase involved in cell wall biosynthesis
MADGRDGTFDGIICIGGEDWWYHNRGHFDFQIMRRLAREWPVLFVNSLGVRMPSPVRDRHFAARIGRKLNSLARGLVHVENRFHVLSPISAPGALGLLTGGTLAPQIRLAARRAGIRHPVLWMHCPAGAPLARTLPHAALVLQRTDRFEAFREGDPERLGFQIADLKRRADLVVYAAPALAAEERDQVRRQLVVTPGVDLDMFAAAGAVRPAPEDIAGLPRPRIGFVGGIDAHTFDPELFSAVARRLPEYRFALIGGCSLASGWCDLANVTFLGRKPYDEVAGYMAACDALIMPWNRSDWIQACNPIKLKEYLAAGRPVVTTDFRALDGWRDLVHIAGDSEGFATAIRAALARPFPYDEALRRLAVETWDAKAQLIKGAIADLGVRFVGVPVAADGAVGAIRLEAPGSPPSCCST